LRVPGTREHCFLYAFVLPPCGHYLKHMARVIQFKRTLTVDKPPATLAEGEIGARHRQRSAADVDRRACGP
jgi:hypothetical protein